jgi:hypothetical protein
MTGLVSLVSNVQESADDLEGYLALLLKFGKPTMFYSEYSNVWMCTLDVHLNIADSKFQVKGKHKNPFEAARACHKNLLTAIAKVTGV